MERFTEQTVKHLEKLSHIQCSPEEEKELALSLSRILDYIEQLNEIDTSQTPPCSYVLRGMLKNLMREDEVKDILPQEKFLQNAPEHIGGMIRVPPVLKQQ